MQNSSRVCSDERPSPLIVYPTDCPMRSPRSAATRSATPTAEIRRGWVQTSRNEPPRPADTAFSSRNCGTCRQRGPRGGGALSLLLGITVTQGVRCCAVRAPPPVVAKDT